MRRRIHNDSIHIYWNYYTHKKMDLCVCVLYYKGTVLHYFENMSGSIIMPFHGLLLCTLKN